MKTLLLLSLVAFPLHAQVSGAVRGGLFLGSGSQVAGGIEVDLRRGNWSLAPAFEVIRGGYGLHAIHLDVRRHFTLQRNVFWVGAGTTFVETNAASSETTWNVETGFAWGKEKLWQPFVAARYYTFDLPVFRDSVDARGPVVSVGISRRFH